MAYVPRPSNMHIRTFNVQSRMSMSLLPPTMTRPSEIVKYTPNTELSPLDLACTDGPLPFVNSQSDMAQSLVLTMPR
jgi:hypothetical protein